MVRGRALVGRFELPFVWNDGLGVAAVRRSTADLVFGEGGGIVGDGDSGGGCEGAGTR